MLTCTNDNHVFTKDLFRGGVTKADVERMREKAKTAGKKKGLPKKDKDPPVCMEDESRITSIVNAILRPELNRIDGDIADVVSSLKEVSAESLGYEKKVIAIVEGIKTTPIARDGNDEIIDNVMENLSHYSMPPAAENKCLVSFEAESPHPHQSNMPSNGKVGESREDHSSRSAHSQTHEHLNPILPSFSLGLTQELGGHHDDDDDEMGENEDQLELAPVSEMFPSLLKHCGCLSEYLETPVVVETVKGVVHNTNPAEAAMTACLLIQTHALYGPQTCSSITPSLVPDKAQRAAVMIYEFHKKL
ncbi:unnamed protein product [Brassica oleracea]